MSVMQAPTFCLHALLLAGGQSKRFGAIKQLLNIGSTTMLAHAVDQISHNDLHALTVVHGAHSKSVARELVAIERVWPHQDICLNVVFNEHWHTGMGSSIASGIASMPRHISHVMICLVDQVALSSSDYARLIAFAKQAPENVVCAVYSGIYGVPAIFPRAYFEDLAQISGDKGAKLLLQALQADDAAISGVDMPKASIDIDTPEDYQNWLRR
ncbi:NTP transferase domain-containing protein [Glaciecola siphonariae]|uniref:NTP transferase domain-containing protein n=1 Tax=Glaciecola siphonariae TaxID=521012 RepID=A0ABV9LTR1_9ALTE